MPHRYSLSFLLLAGTLLIAGGALASSSAPQATAPVSLDPVKGLENSLTPQTPPPGMPMVDRPVPPAETEDVNVLADLGIEDKSTEEIATEGFQPSFKNWQGSLLFPSKKLEDLKRILVYFESRGAPSEQNAASQETADIVDSIMEDIKAAEGAEKPVVITFPTFRLNSILLEANAGWTVFLNDRKISEKANIPDGEIHILSVTRNAVTFQWKPQDPALVKELQTRRQNAQSAGSFPESPQAYRVAVSIPVANVRPNDAAITFTLRPNQTFSPEYMAVYEGLAPGMAPKNRAAVQEANGHLPRTAAPTEPVAAPPADVPPMDKQRGLVESLSSRFNRTAENAALVESSDKPAAVSEPAAENNSPAQAAPAAPL